MSKFCRKKKKIPKNTFAEVLDPIASPKKIHPILKKYFQEAQKIKSKKLHAHSFNLYLIPWLTFFSVVWKNSFAKHSAEDYQSFQDTFQQTYEPPEFPFYLSCVCSDSHLVDCLGCTIMSCGMEMSDTSLESYLIIKKYE